MQWVNFILNLIILFCVLGLVGKAIDPKEPKSSLPQSEPKFIKTPVKKPKVKKVKS